MTNDPRILELLDWEAVTGAPLPRPAAPGTVDTARAALATLATALQAAARDRKAVTT